MRASEVFEAEIDQHIALSIYKQNKELTTLLSTFDTVVQSNGYERAYRSANDVLINYSATDWYLVKLIEGNSKLQHSFDRLVRTRNALGGENKIRCIMTMLKSV